MAITSLGMSVVKAGTQVGKHKVPRFLYHMTNKSNYESILNDGLLKMSSDEAMGTGVFMTELTNLFKRWRKNNAWENESLQEMLIKQVAKGNNDIVILRIPTRNLDNSLLRVEVKIGCFLGVFQKKEILLLMK